MEQVELRATGRKLLGKKVRFLRRQGITPVHLFGHDTEPLALQCDTTQLEHVLTHSGKTRLIGLKLDRARKLRSVVVREVQKHPLSGEIIHVDFYQVSMTEKIKVDVPITLIGEAPALRLKGTMLVHELNRLNVECLPDRIPANVQVDISSLAEEDQSIHVKDISLGEGITVLDDPEHVIVRVALLTIEKVAEVEKVAEAEAEAVTEAGAEAGAEAAPTPGEEAKGEKEKKEK
jgi:large subunit ribosomal protein L25